MDIKAGEQISRLKTVDKTCCFIKAKCKLIAPQLLPIIVLRWCAKELVIELT